MRIPEEIGVLLVEDDPGDAGLIRYALRSAKPYSFALHVAVSMREAKEVLAQTRFDIVLLDLTLPDTVGLETVRAARGVAGSTPIIILTGHDDHELAFAALQAGAQDYLVKGKLDPDALMRAIRYTLVRRQAEGEIALLARRNEMLLDSICEGIYGIDTAGKIIFINPAGAAALGYEPKELIGGDSHRIFHHSRRDGSPYPPQECPILLTVFDGLRRREENEWFLRRDGSGFPVNLTVAPMEEQGQTAGAVVVFRDQSAQWAAEQKVRLLGAALETTANAVVITDTGGTIEWVNPAFGALTGFSSREALGKTPGALVRSGRQSTPFYADMWNTILAGRAWKGELVNQHRDGTHYHEEMSITPVFDEGGAIRNFIAVKQDITLRKEQERALLHLATIDFLTGLPNRRYFLERLEQELARVKRFGTPAALLALDIDHFKRINDTWGHSAGDEVLRHFGKLIEESMRRTDFAGRMGGEEFAVFLTETSAQNASVLAQRLLEKVAAHPVEVPGGAIRFTVSIGLSVIRPTDYDPQEALLRADAALYRAKSMGRNRVEPFIDPTAQAPRV